MILLVAAMVFPASARVLCIGSNGHVAIELAHLLDECGKVQGAGLASESISIVEMEPDGCVDLALDVAWWSRLGQDREGLQTVAPVSFYSAYLTAAIVSSHKQSNVLRWSDQHGTPERLLTVRSTVLLL